MNSQTNKIFPFLLDVLSHKPDLEETHKVLLDNLRTKLKEEDIKLRNVKSEFEDALEIGQNLGVIRIVEDSIWMPIFSEKKEHTSNNPSAANAKADKPMRSRSSKSSRQSRSRSSRRSSSRSTRGRANRRISRRRRSKSAH